MKRLLIFAIILSAVLGCSRGDVTREDWEAMTPDTKLLIVDSFKGHESAREAKGGTGRLHPESSEHYRNRIDEIYRAGDERPVNAIWEELVSEKPPAQEKP